MREGMLRGQNKSVKSLQDVEGYEDVPEREPGEAYETGIVRGEREGIERHGRRENKGVEIVEENGRTDDKPPDKGSNTKHGPLICYTLDAKMAGVMGLRGDEREAGE